MHKSEKSIMNTKFDSITLFAKGLVETNIPRNLV